MRIILCFLLALVAAPAWAEWVKVGEARDGSGATYIDPATIRKDGNFRKVWVIQDLKQRGTDGEMSRRVLEEFDCKEERYRILAYSFHSEPMAGGKMLLFSDDPTKGSTTPTKWTATPPNTAVGNKLQIVCAK